MEDESDDDGGNDDSDTGTEKLEFACGQLAGDVARVPAAKQNGSALKGKPQLRKVQESDDDEEVNIEFPAFSKTSKVLFHKV
jgi:hypothetical protein